MLSIKNVSTIAPKRIAVKLNAKGEQYVVKGHPWVFSDSIVKVNDDAKTGDLAIIFSKNKNKLIGLGLYDGNSPIRIKILTRWFSRSYCRCLYICTCCKTVF